MDVGLPPSSRTLPMDQANERPEQIYLLPAADFPSISTSGHQLEPYQSISDTRTLTFERSSVWYKVKIFVDTCI